MKVIKAKQVLFIQGGGNGGYDADEALVISLQKNLGKEYQIHYPEIQTNETVSDFGWLQEIDKNISKINDDFILAGHSFGASMILKYLSENSITQKIKGILLIATPFWNGNEEWITGLKLKNDFADKLPADTPIFLYHCKDDGEIPYSHFEQYKQKLNRAIFREIERGGHQFNNDLTLVADDIKSL